MVNLEMFCQTKITLYAIYKCCVFIVQVTVYQTIFAKVLIQTILAKIIPNKHPNIPLRSRLTGNS